MRQPAFLIACFEDTFNQFTLTHPFFQRLVGLSSQNSGPHQSICYRLILWIPFSTCTNSRGLYEAFPVQKRHLLATVRNSELAAKTRSCQGVSLYRIRTHSALIAGKPSKTASRNSTYYRAYEIDQDSSPGVGRSAILWPG